MTESRGAGPRHGPTHIANKNKTPNTVRAHAQAGVTHARKPDAHTSARPEANKKAQTTKEGCSADQDSVE